MRPSIAQQSAAVKPRGVRRASGSNEDSQRLGFELCEYFNNITGRKDAMRDSTIRSVVSLLADPLWMHFNRVNTRFAMQRNEL